MDWFKILSLGGTKTVNKSWFGDAGCSISHSIFDLFFFFFFLINNNAKEKKGNCSSCTVGRQKSKLGYRYAELGTVKAKKKKKN